VHRRIGTDTPLGSAVDDDALEFLIQCSGGHTRQLLTFLRQAATLTDKAPIGLRVAQQAIEDTVSLYGRMPRAYWPKLAELELSLDQDIDTADEDIRKMLQQLIVLEYRNGGEREAPSIPQWYAVHPIVRALRPFKAAVEEAKG
jgi:hypothetical protein